MKYQYNIFHQHFIIVIMFIILIIMFNFKHIIYSIFKLTYLLTNQIIITPFFIQINKINIYLKYNNYN